MSATGKHKNTRQYKSEIIKLYVEGKSIREISKIYNVGKGVISNLIKEDMELRPKSSVESLKDEFYEMYKNGYNFNQIAKQYQVNSGSVSRVLRKYYDDVDKGARKYEDLIPLFKKDYASGSSLSDIATKYGVSTQLVLDYLHSEKEEIRDYSKSSRKYELVEDYFDVLDDKKARQLGLFFALATLNIVNTSYNTDLKIVKGYISFLEEALEGIRPKEDINIYYYEKENTVSTRLSSKYLYNRLTELGLVSGNIQISDEFKDTFMAAYFDVRLTVIYKELNINCKTKYFDFIYNYLVNDLSIPSNNLRYRDKTSIIIGNMSAIRILEGKYNNLRGKIENYVNKSEPKMSKWSKWESYLTKYEKL